MPGNKSGGCILFTDNINYIFSRELQPRRDTLSEKRRFNQSSFSKPDPSIAFSAQPIKGSVFTGREPRLGGQLREKAVWVDEAICIGCRYCAHVASNTFVIEPGAKTKNGSIYQFHITRNKILY